MPRLATAVGNLLQSLDGTPSHVLWSLTYHHKNVDRSGDVDTNMIILPNVPVEIGLPDSVLDSVKTAWERITGETDGFMVFEAREGMEDED